MSKELARREPSADDAQLALTMANAKTLVKRSLLALPLELRPAALRLWMCHKHLTGLESPLPIAAALAIWIDRHGLTVSDAEGCVDAMMAPEMMGQHKFASDLTASLAARVAEVLRRRRIEREQEQRRREAIKSSIERAPPEVIAKAVAAVKGFGEVDRPEIDREALRRRNEEFI